ncbi:MAG: Dna2/Cas4 domain-containing protein [Candidatus Aenigmarchaeota archaeon]|nr:Dna2/Cas4 domain-containing protein [Candidatus Aenigmarchaeota archaeon]
MRIDSDGNSWIAISEFHQQSYCEVQLKYKWQGIRKETPAMKKGSEVHQKKFEEFEEKTKELEQVGISNAIKLAMEKDERFSGREIFIMSPTFRIFGVIDFLEISSGGIIVADDKPGDHSYLSDKSQIIAYAMAFKDQYRPPLDIFMRIQNRESGDITWEDVLSQEWVEFLLEKIERLHDLATGKRDFEPTKNPKKCAACSYRDICDKKVGG